MPLDVEMKHPRSMSFANQRKVMILRDVHKKAWSYIVTQVVNLQNEQPSERQCREVYANFNIRAGKRKYNYSKCGRKPWKVSKDVESYLIKKLCQLRKKQLCTSTTLQRELKRDKKVTLEASTIRKVLKKHGYQWLPRAQKPKYSKDDKALRVKFAKKALFEKFQFSLDGIILHVPLVDATDRENYCRVGETHIWRKTNEAAMPELAGADSYDKQLPPSRMLPLWGGIGEAGFGLVFFHPRRKTNKVEWMQAVKEGRLSRACKDASGQLRGPWRVLCDNESFLKAKGMKKEYAKRNLKLRHIPSRSPDLNPVERFWGWTRKRLRAMDLADLNKKRPPIGKTALKARVKTSGRPKRRRRWPRIISSLSRRFAKKL